MNEFIFDIFDSRYNNILIISKVLLICWL